MQVKPNYHLVKNKYGAFFANYIFPANLFRSNLVKKGGDDGSLSCLHLDHHQYGPCQACTEPGWFGGDPNQWHCRMKMTRSCNCRAFPKYTSGIFWLRFEAATLMTRSRKTKSSQVLAAFEIPLFFSCAGFTRFFSQERPESESTLTYFNDVYHHHIFSHLDRFGFVHVMSRPVGLAAAGVCFGSRRITPEPSQVRHKPQQLEMCHDPTRSVEQRVKKHVKFSSVSEWRCVIYIYAWINMNLAYQKVDLRVYWLSTWLSFGTDRSCRASKLQRWNCFHLGCRPNGVMAQSWKFG